MKFFSKDLTVKVRLDTIHKYCVTSKQTAIKYAHDENYPMKRRITISIKGELERSVRRIQSQLIEESGDAISFSKTIEMLIQRALVNNERDEQIILEYMCSKKSAN